jgi:C-terminal processing protease CtpA/Prc
VNKIGIKLKKEADNIVVSEVEEGSLSFIYGIKIGDIILDVSGNKIKTIQEYNNCIHTLKNLRIKLLRGKEVKYIAFKKS